MRRENCQKWATGNWATEEPIGKLGIWELKLNLKLKSYPVPKSLHVSYLIFCYKLKDFNDTLDDGDDRSANWNCLLKVRITEQAGRQAGTESRPRVRARDRDREQQGQHLGPARDPNEADSGAGTSMGAKMPRNGEPGKTNRMRCVPPPRVCSPASCWSRCCFCCCR